MIPLPKDMGGSQALCRETSLGARDSISRVWVGRGSNGSQTAQRVFSWFPRSVEVEVEADVGWWLLKVIGRESGSGE